MQEEKSINCSCGKMIAKERNGKVYLWCKSCHKEVELKIEKESRYEPKKAPQSLVYTT